MNNNISKVQKNIVIFSIIGLVLFLVIGITYAYFSLSVSNRTTDLTSVSNIGLTYDDDTLYTISGLIPTSREFAIKGSSRSLSDKCKDDNGYAICSLYEFTVTNTANVAQELSIYMTPILNEYSNLKYMVYTGGNTSITESTNPTVDTQSLTLNSTDNINLINHNPTLKPNENLTYTILFYIENLDYNQTEDIGKVFTAGININSITLGTFISGSFGESCWTTTQLESTNNYSLTNFNGLYENGEIKEECTSYISDDVTTEGYQYTINVPGNIGGKTITTVGDYLFYPLYSLYSGNNIVDNNVIVNEVSSSNKKIIPSLLSTVLVGYNAELTPMEINYLKIISINIEEGIKYIGEDSFSELENLSSVTLPNSLLEIGNSSFFCKDCISLDSIVIPSSVTTIGDDAFSGNNDLTSVTYIGSENNTSSLTTIGDSAFYKANLSTITIPKSVVTIGDSAFSSASISTITFEGATDGTSNLTAIGEYAFSGNNLTYNSQENPLIIPASVTSIGPYAFMSFNTSNANPSLDYIRPLAGDIYGNTWYNSTDTILVLD